MKGFLSAININNTLSTKEVINHNKFQMRFLDKFYYNKTLIKIMMTKITCSLLDSTSTSNDDEMNIIFSKPF